MDDIKFDDPAAAGPSPARPSVLRPDGTPLREVGPEGEGRGGADNERDPSVLDD